MAEPDHRTGRSRSVSSGVSTETGRTAPDEHPVPPRAEWSSVRYFDAAALGAVVGIALSAFVIATPAAVVISAMAGALLGTAMAWAMKRRGAQ